MVSLLFKRNKRLLYFWVICFLFCSLSCEENSNNNKFNNHVSQINCDVNKFIWDKVNDNRVVLIGDFGHGQPQYLQVVTDALNYWVDNIENDDSLFAKLPRKLFLIIERDSLSTANLKTFFETGNILDAFGDIIHLSFQNTTVTIEHYYELRNIWLRLEKYNSSAKETNKISFDIIGPEKAIDPTNWSIEKRSEFFLNERDEYSSDKIVKLLNNNRDHKALLFYGSAHLNKFKTIKHLHNGESEGYFLGYYLKEYLGDDSIYTLAQYRFTQNMLTSSEIAKNCEKIAVDIEFVDESDVNPIFRNMGFEGAVFCHNKKSVYCFLNTIPTETLVKFIMDNLNEIYFGDNFVLTGYKKGVLEYMTRITGNNYLTVNLKNEKSVKEFIGEIENWYSNNKIDLVDDIVSLSIWKRLIELMSDSSDASVNYIEKMITNTPGVISYFDSTISIQERADIYREYLPDDSIEIIINNLINLLWIGTPEECSKAILVLQNMTGNKYESAAEWMDWLNNRNVGRYNK